MSGFDAIVLISIAPAYLLGKFLLENGPSPKPSKDAIKATYLFGLLALIFSLLFGLLVTKANVFSGMSAWKTLVLATSEEVFKFLPFALFVWKKEFFSRVTDGVIYFAFVGMVFGAIETFMYTLGGGAFTGIMRFGIGMYLHAALTGLAGAALAYYKVVPKAKILAPAVVLAAASLLHFQYNLGLGLGGESSTLSIILSIMIAAASSIGLFVIFSRFAVLELASTSTKPANSGSGFAKPNSYHLDVSSQTRHQPNL